MRITALLRPDVIPLLFPVAGMKELRQKDVRQKDVLLARYLCSAVIVAGYRRMRNSRFLLPEGTWQRPTERISNKEQGTRNDECRRADVFGSAAADVHCRLNVFRPQWRQRGLEGEQIEGGTYF